MSRRKPSPFQNCETREAFLVALQQQLASGNLTVAELDAAKLLCKLKGWDTPAAGNSGEMPEASVVSEAASPTAAIPVSEGDGSWYWCPCSGGYMTLFAAIRADRPIPNKTWQGPLTTAEMAQEYNSQAEDVLKYAIAAGYGYDHSGGGFWRIVVLTPKGRSSVLCVELPCTVQKLDAMNAEPDPRTLDHW